MGYAGRLRNYIDFLKLENKQTKNRPYFRNIRYSGKRTLWAVSRGKPLCKQIAVFLRVKPDNEALPDDLITPLGIRVDG